MCGILGYVLRPGAEPLAPGRLAAARDVMTHRGPDDAGCWEEPGVGLAHRRLSIQDLSAAGRQPMRLGDRRLWITYNGEVYNFPDLRDRLIERGVAFRSRTDTEVALALYAELGDDVVTALRGMYAFGIWDGERDRLLLACDRVGKKPLYYAETDRGLAFASTIHALLALGWVEPKLRHDRLPEYLALGRVAAPDTLLEGVSKLHPGHLLSFEPDKPARVRAYHEPVCAEASLPDRDGTLADTLRESVRMRLISDVPVGVTLSGGVDSSLVAALVRERPEVPLKTFTVAFTGEDEVNEAHHARAIAEYLGAEHHEVWLEPDDVVAALPDVEPHLDEPHPNLIWLATYFVSRLARENGVTVLLTGDGGDELFFGYSRWVALLRAYRRFIGPLEAMPGPLRSLAASAVGVAGGDEAVREIARRVRSKDPVFWGPMYFYPAAMDELLTAGGRDLVRAHPPGERLRERFERFPRTGDRVTDFIRWVRTAGLQGNLVYDFLSRLDRMGMAVSVEGRCPLLDQEVVKLALGWPADDLFDGKGLGKMPLRRLLGTLYPKELVERPKMGFCAPTLNWIRGGLRDLVIASLEELADEIPVFERNRLKRWIETPPTDRRDAARMWGLVSLARWWRRLPRAVAANA